MHWLMLAGAAAFLALGWTPLIRRFWKFWTLGICVFVMATFVGISSITHDPESRFIAIMLCPLATASFVNWGPRWQLAISAVSIASFLAADILVPIPSEFTAYRWLGLLAGLAFGESTALFLDRYRRRIGHQLDALEEAARFREMQMATMAHDIRNPVSALAGYVQILQEGDLDEEEREELLARIGSTAWNTNLVVGNVLDLYRIEGNGQLSPNPVETNPNLIIAEAAEDCAAEAHRKGPELRTDFQPLPRTVIDPRHLDRIVRNLVSVPIAFASDGEIMLRTAIREARIVIEVAASAVRISLSDLEQMTMRPANNGRPARAKGIGLYLAKAMTEAAGGSLEARIPESGGIVLSAAIPVSPGAHP